MKQATYLFDKNRVTRTMLREYFELLNIPLMFVEFTRELDIISEFVEIQKGNLPRPKLLLINLDTISRPLKLTRLINYEYGNNVLIGLVCKRITKSKQMSLLEKETNFLLTWNNSFDVNLLKWYYDYTFLDEPFNTFKVYNETKNTPK